MTGRRAVRSVLILFSIAIVLVAMMTFTGRWPSGENPYQSYRLQAYAWLDGHLDLGQDYSWLELAIYKGKYYVSFPPFPSYILLPYCLLFQNGTPEHWIMIALMAIAVFYAMELYSTFRRDARGMEFFILFLFLGNGYLFVALQGWVWFFAQSMCFTLSLMALTHAAKGQGGMALSCWACAVGCRPMVAVYLPLILYLVWQRQKSRVDSFVVLVRRKWYWAILPALVIASYLLLNLLRFDNAFEFGHNYLPEHTRTATGQFDASYILHNLHEYLRLPGISRENGALSYPTFGGLAFWLIDPIVVTAFFAWVYAFNRKRQDHRFTLMGLPLMVFAHVFILLCHSTLGGWQFGNRYLLDVLPYLFCGMLLWAPAHDDFVVLNMPLFLMGSSVNLIGAVATYNKWI